MQTSHQGQWEFWLIYRLQQLESWYSFNDCLHRTERHSGGKKQISNPKTSSIISPSAKFHSLREKIPTIWRKNFLRNLTHDCSIFLSKSWSC